jgi:hypothetical protein
MHNYSLLYIYLAYMFRPYPVIIRALRYTKGFKTCLKYLHYNIVNIPSSWLCGVKWFETDVSGQPIGSIFFDILTREDGADV